MTREITSDEISAINDNLSGYVHGGDFIEALYAEDRLEHLLDDDDFWEAVQAAIKPLRIFILTP